MQNPADDTNQFGGKKNAPGSKGYILDFQTANVKRANPGPNVFSFLGR
jgi:hypothetical protein